MKYRRISSFFLLIIYMISAGVYAEVLVKDRSDIAGTWKLRMTASNIEGTHGHEENYTWLFKPNGAVIISGYNKFMGQDTRFEKSYEVEVKEDSIIKITDALGTKKYKVVEKKADEMILDGPYGYYFFKKE